MIFQWIMAEGCLVFSLLLTRHAALKLFFFRFVFYLEVDLIFLNVVLASLPSLLPHALFESPSVFHVARSCRSVAVNLVCLFILHLLPTLGGVIIPSTLGGCNRLLN